MMDERIPPLDAIYWHQYVVQLVAKEPARLPPYAGSTVRGAFGQAIKELVCPRVENRLQGNCDRCGAAVDCLYSAFFETRPNEREENSLRYARLPPAYCLDPAPSLVDRWIAGRSPPEQELAIDESFHFELLFFGRANLRLLPRLIEILQRLAACGLGAGQARFALKSVLSILPDEPPLFLYPQTACRAAENRTSWQDLHRSLPPVPNTVTLQWLSPVRIKFRDCLLKHQLPFQVLMERLCERLDLVARTHCLSPPWDWQPLVEEARRVVVVENRLSWLELERRSKKSGSMGIGGMMGTIAYVGNLAPFWPLLWLGQVLHLGKFTVLGLGRYQLVLPDS